MKLKISLFALLFAATAAFAQEEKLPGRSTPVYTNFEDHEMQIPSQGAIDALKSYFQIDNRFTFSVLSTIQDELGFSHTRYKQYCNGIPVEGSMWIFHERNNQVVSVNGDVFNIKSSITTPSLNEEQARFAAIQYIAAATYSWQIPKAQLGDDSVTYGLPPTGELVYVPEDGAFDTKEFRLAYKFDIYAVEPLAHSYVFIDALNGKPLWMVSQIHDIATNGTAGTLYSGTQNIKIDSLSTTSFKLYDATRGGGISTKNLSNLTSGTGFDVTSVTNSFTSATNTVKAIYDAHWGAGLSYDYFKDTFNRNSYDGNGGALLVRTRYGTNYQNAFWQNRSLTFGDGNGTTSTPWTSLDVVGHEFTHGVVQYTAGLYYIGESGALNESFSDIFGQTIEFINKPTAASWLISEDVIVGGLRNMANPKNKNQPDTYLGTNWVTTSTDNYGVHYNSGVQNYWFYLLSVGNTGTNDNNKTYNVTGIGLHKAAKIAYRNLSVYLTPASGYKIARQFAIQSARDLYGACSNEVTQTETAWYAVGLLDSVTTAGTSFTNTPSTTCQNYLTVKFNNTSTAVQSSLWYFGDGTTSTSNNPTHSYTQAGVYNVKLVVTHCNNQKDSITVNAAVTVSNLGAICDTIKMDKPLQSSTLCNAIVTDDGGVAGNYSNSSRSYLLFNDPTVSQYKLTFLNFNTESSYDYLFVYDGDTTSTYTYYSGLLSPVPFIASSGKLLIIFQTDNTSVYPGFVLKVECLSPLPITLQKWTVSAQNCENKINWSLGSSKDFSHYDIEKSEDGQKFIKLATINSIPNTTDYSYNDNITSSADKRIYYRLKMVDINDAFSYANTISVFPNCHGRSAWSIAPNPAETRLIITSGEAIQNIRIFATNGSLVKLVAINQDKNVTVDINELATGTYFLELESTAGIKQYKMFVKQ